MRTGWLLALGLAVGSLGVYAACAPAPADEAARSPEREKWAEHMGDLPFVIGFDKGMKQSEFTGKPPMLFFTATW